MELIAGHDFITKILETCRGSYGTRLAKRWDGALKVERKLSAAQAAHFRLSQPSPQRAAGCRGLARRFVFVILDPCDHRIVISQ
eukprot:14982558-Heterocapsa_arctica.AAC.1